MKSTGIVRRVDDLGRVVLPKEIRRILGINEDTSMEIYVDEDKIILKKYNPGCHCCGKIDDLVEVKGLALCKDCVMLFDKSMSRLLPGGEAEAI